MKIDDSWIETNLSANSIKGDINSTTLKLSCADNLSSMVLFYAPPLKRLRNAKNGNKCKSIYRF